MKPKNISSSPMMDLVKKMAIATLIGAVSTFIVLCVMALVLSVKDIPTTAISAMSSTAAGIGAFVAGFAAAKLYKKRGAIIGAAAGAILFIVIFIASLIIAGAELTVTVLLRLVLMLLAAAVGGIIAVNMRGRKKKI